MLKDKMGASDVENAADISNKTLFFEYLNRPNHRSDNHLRSDCVTPPPATRRTALHRTEDAVKQR